MLFYILCRSIVFYNFSSSSAISTIYICIRSPTISESILLSRILTDYHLDEQGHIDRGESRHFGPEKPFFRRFHNRINDCGNARNGYYPRKRERDTAPRHARQRGDDRGPLVYVPRDRLPERGRVGHEREGGGGQEREELRAFRACFNPRGHYPQRGHRQAHGEQPIRPLQVFQQIVGLRQRCRDAASPHGPRRVSSQHEQADAVK